jgi:hypothetical protein
MPTVTHGKGMAFTWPANVTGEFGADLSQTMKVLIEPAVSMLITLITFLTISPNQGAQPAQHVQHGQGNRSSA